MNGNTMMDDPKTNRRNSKYIADTFILHLFLFKTILFIGIRLSWHADSPTIGSFYFSFSAFLRMLFVRVVADGTWNCDASV